MIAADPDKPPVLPLNNSWGKNGSGLGKDGGDILELVGGVSEGDEKVSQKPVTLL